MAAHVRYHYYYRPEPITWPHPGKHSTGWWALAIPAYAIFLAFYIVYRLVVVPLIRFGQALVWSSQEIKRRKNKRYWTPVRDNAAQIVYDVPRPPKMYRCTLCGQAGFSQHCEHCGGNSVTAIR